MAYDFGSSTISGSSRVPVRAQINNLKWKKLKSSSQTRVESTGGIACTPRKEMEASSIGG